MAEMRRPRDFWKSALCGQSFCYLTYMVFGLLCYSRQGQYSSILPNLNFDNQSLIIANNVIFLITTVVTATLFSNIGVKAFYEIVLRPYLKAPPLFSQPGRWYWMFTVSGYWVLAWILCSAVPNLTSLVTLISSICILQFTYTIPPALLLGFWVQRDALRSEVPSGADGESHFDCIDTWKNRSRWFRGFRRYWYVKTFLVSLPLPNPYQQWLELICLIF